MSSLVLLMCGVAAGGSSDALRFVVSDAPDLNRLFDISRMRPSAAGSPNHGLQWLGADVGVSLPLTASTTLWLWGDTLIGNVVRNQTYPGGYRAWTTMPRNAVSLLNLTRSRDGAVEPGAPTFHWGHLYGPDGELDGPLFFNRSSAPSHEWLWPAAALLLRGQLHLMAYHCVADSTSAYNFDAAGTTTLRVLGDPLAAPPENWTYQIARVPRSGPSVNWAAGMALADADGSPGSRFVFIFGTVNYVVPNNSSHHNAIGTVLSRVPAESWPDFAAAEYLVDADEPGSNWTRNFDAAFRLRLVVENVTLSAPQFLPGIGAWCAFGVHSETPRGTPEFFAYFSPSLAGPWAPRRIFSPPAPWTDTSRYQVYSPALHPSLAALPPAGGAAELVLSYLTNTPSNSSLLRTDLRTYVPRFVRIAVYN